MDILVTLLVFLFSGQPAECSKDITGRYQCPAVNYSVKEQINGRYQFKNSGRQVTCSPVISGGYDCSNGYRVLERIAGIIIVKQGPREIERCRYNSVGPFACQSGIACRVEINQKITCK